MSWLLCFFYFASGLIAGAVGIVYSMAFALSHHISTRLQFFRAMARHFPIEARRACIDLELIEPDEDFGPDAEFEAIDFHTCDVCNLPWPIENKRVVAHIDLTNPERTTRECTGSNKKVR